MKNKLSTFAKSLKVTPLNFSRLKNLFLSGEWKILVSDPQKKKKMRKKQKNDFSRQSDIITKLEYFMNTHKAYRNPNMTIADLAIKTGTNRTYLSSTINKFYNHNFPTYLNTYRFKEMKECIKTNPDLSNNELAEKCGFGSVDSMKRTTNSFTGHSFSEFKRRILDE